MEELGFIRFAGRSVEETVGETRPFSACGRDQKIFRHLFYRGMYLLRVRKAVKRNLRFYALHLFVYFYNLDMPVDSPSAT